MKQFISLLVCATLICSVIICDPFVIENKKKQSSPQLKEKIGDSYERIAKRSSRLICKLSQTTHDLIDGTSELLNGKCGSNIAELKEYAAQLEQVEDDLAQCEKKIDNLARVVEHRVIAKK